MTYMLRERPDGQTEIIVNQPRVVGVFPEREVAERVCVFLQDDLIDWPEDRPAGFGTAAADVAEAELDLIEDIEGEARPAPKRTRQNSGGGVRNLPAVVPDRPFMPAVRPADAPHLTEDQRDAAFRRLTEGEKIAAVAPEFGLTTFQLQGMWAAYRKQMQRHLAEGGQIPCTGCQRPFTPSITSPDKCARCSHE